MAIQAWHFVNDKLRDGRPVPRNGRWLKHDGALVLCASGLHASLKPSQALKFAPGATLCLVECAGEIKHDNNKLVCMERRIVMRMDATNLLRFFARMQALSVSHLYESLDVVTEFLLTGDESLRSVARSAARSAAWSAARSAAESAAESAARSAARSAAWSAAWADFDCLVY